MGLDWSLIPRARTGFETAHAKVVRERKLVRAFWKDDEGLLCGSEEVPGADSYYAARDLLLEQFDAMLREISVQPEEDIGCPRIGIDQEATEWFRASRYEVQRAQDPGHPLWSRPFEEVAQAFHGTYVEQLAKVRPDDGGPICSPMDFRGKLLRHVEPFLCDPAVVWEAWSDHDAFEALDYARRLEAVLEASAPENRDEAREIVEAAVRWLRFWGGRGFGFDASY